MKHITCTVVVAIMLTACGGGSKESTETKSTSSAQSGGAAAQHSTNVAPRATLAESASKAVENTAAIAQQAADQVNAKAQELLEQAKTLLSEKRVQDAGALLDQVSGMTLDTEQQKLLADLKEEVKKVSVEIGGELGEIKTLVAEKKYTEATAALSKVVEYQLTPEQKKVVDDLKGQVEKMLGTEATQEGAKALKNLLGH